MSETNDDLTPPAQALPQQTGHRRSPNTLMWSIAVVAAAAGAALWWWKFRTGDAPVSATAASAPATGAGGGFGAGARRFGAGNRVQPVSVQPVRRQDVRVSVDAIGTIAAYNTAVVRAQVSGVLRSLAFKEGQQVRAGELLAQIDPRAFAAALTQAEGALARDKAQLENAKLDLVRYQDLLAKDAIASQQLDTQRALVKQLEGTVTTDQGVLDNARLQLSYTHVTAPIAGRIGLKQADLGNVVTPADANGIVSITQTRPIALVFAVPAAHLARISAQLRKHVSLPVEAFDRAGAARLAAGRVDTIDNAIDPTTDTIKVKAVFPNQDDALFPNQAVTVKLQLDTLADAVVVPPAAVLRGAQGFYVYVVDAQSTVSARVVRPGPVDANAMAVSGELEPGERVVVDGVDRLRDGAKVEVIAADPRQRAGAAGPPGGRRGPRGASAPGGSAAPGGGDQKSRSAHEGAAAAAATGTAPASAAPTAGAERPAWLDRLPPEVAQKLMAMTPEERRAWIQKRREAREAAGAAGGGTN